MNQYEVEVFNTVGSFLGAYAGKDINTCLSYIATGMPLLIMGTNDDEIITSYDEIRDAFEADFSVMENVSWGEVRYSYVKAENSLGSVLVELPINFTNQGMESSVLFRYALTLVRQGNEWKICAFLTSVPYESGAGS
ncbi:MAG TPA: nuclear transport factor 2 family protein [Chitinispirillaceae bacterium]|jgi:ketosteroid isomerase-like protein|nr:nuclear transport factor 2 family protein [Chitinispirillaceae bacterium]